MTVRWCSGSERMASITTSRRWACRSDSSGLFVPEPEEPPSASTSGAASSDPGSASSEARIGCPRRRRQASFAAFTATR